MELLDWFKGFEKGISCLSQEQQASFFSERGEIPQKRATTFWPLSGLMYMTLPYLPTSACTMYSKRSTGKKMRGSGYSRTNDTAIFRMNS